ncbi:cation:proton antiporter [Agrobacterium larrymoorei]|uniref:monovalent cation/H(+) antiporter subunit G n=1 Tax=Agrobacterium larrymoorei TaxID=160699 RepID=UPI0015747C8D|nr:monovalent cation/H(+) antiporter subunit G [Agrobacterium larrymoorei]NTJ41310.1 cation:proton antiporter [Agrobacterium larrymoorei]
MSNAAEFPLWAAILVAFFVLLGSGLTLIGTIGFAKLQSFYERLHAPTLGTSWGTGGIVMASIIYFSVSGDRLVFHEIFIGIFMTVTTPISLMLLGRAALYRDRAEQNREDRERL